MEWWVVLLLPIIVLIVHWFDYSRSIQEYTFAQPEAGLGSIITEKTPVVFEVGALPWRPEISAKSPWKVETGDGNVVSISTIDPINAGIENNGDLANQMELAKGLAEIDEARPLWWLPGLFATSVDILQEREVTALSWVTAERQWIGCSSGGPMLIWLAHSRYRRFLPESVMDPWALYSISRYAFNRAGQLEYRPTGVIRSVPTL